MCPCGVLLGAAPVLGQRGLAQQRGVIYGWSFFENRHQRAARRRHRKRLDEMHLAVRFNDGLDRFHLASTIPCGAPGAKGNSYANNPNPNAAWRVRLREW